MKDSPTGENSYHKTTSLEQGQLFDFEFKAANQDEAVLAVLKRFKRSMTASEVFTYLAFAKWPLTSIRRSMSNLCKEYRENPPKLVKLKKTKNGIYGRPEHFYRMKHQKDLK